MKVQISAIICRYPQLFGDICSYFQMSAHVD